MPKQREKTCPRCQEMRLKSWVELSDEEKFLAKSLALSAEYTPAQRKKHLFCTLCWFEVPRQQEILT